MKKIKIAYWIFTGLMTLIVAGSAFMYFSKTQEVKAAFEALGYPSYLVIPLGTAKILALIAIFSGLSKTLKEWAYFGLLVDFILAATAHLHTQDGQSGGAFFALGAWFFSYLFWKQL